MNNNSTRMTSLTSLLEQISHIFSGVFTVEFGQFIMAGKHLFCIQDAIYTTQNWPTANMNTFNKHAYVQSKHEKDY